MASNYSDHLRKRKAALAFETQVRENNGPWLTSRVKKGPLFLAAAGAAYDFRHRTLTPEPYEVVLGPCYCCG
jgi:hypothetical protein